jgi:hypothetical protein
MARRLHQTMADYVVIAISPALIMTLVGSLVFFLLTVLYQGEFALRLHWVMACFVFAAVLIGRISIEEGFERAAPFGIALATVVGLAATKFMEVNGTWIDQFGFLINWALIALIWWCAHRLTWDCTLIDDTQDASGQGLLQVAGLERAADSAKAVEMLPKSVEVPAEATEDFERRLESTTSRAPRAGWWQRFVEHQHRSHAPGVWVVYFSLAALPLFGIGQWFIPATNVGGRRYAFWLLCVYVASGLGLLVTTSFLGLRRYLRQRRIEMPTLMANLWLGCGATIIGLLLILAALLPRPSAEYPISQLPFTLGSPGQPSASSSAPASQEGRQDQQQPGSAPTGEAPESEDKLPADQPKAGSAGGSGLQDQKADQPAGGQSSAAQSSAQSQANGGESSKSSKKPASGEQGRAGQESKQSPSAADDQQGKNVQPGESPRPTGSTPSKDDIAQLIEKLKNDQLARQPAPPSRPPSAPPPANENPPSKENPTPEAKTAPAEPAPQPSEPEMPPPSEFAEALKTATSVGEFFKALFYFIFAFGVLFLAWRSRAEILAMLRELLAFLQGLLGGRKRDRVAAGQATAEPEFPPAPFASFADPFTTGIAARYSAGELVRYSFEAFEAWSREHGCPRTSDQTPHELARDVSKLNASMAADARNLAELYARAAYGSGQLPANTAEQLSRLWQRMRSTSVAHFPGEV